MAMRAIDEAAELPTIFPKKMQRDETRSGDVARLAHQIKVVDRGTFEDFENEVHERHADWAADQRDLHRQIYRAWKLIPTPPGYDDIFDVYRDNSIDAHQYFGLFCIQWSSIGQLFFYLSTSFGPNGLGGSLRRGRSGEYCFGI